MPAEASEFAPAFAIIIPIYRQPGLAVEAIAAALDEAESTDGLVVLVNDGCPLAETDALCRDFAAAAPARVLYLRTDNRGLPAARNHGIVQALARFPSLGAVFLLDADNLLVRGAMQRGLAALRRSGADWVYPDMEKFGAPGCGRAWHGDMSGPYSVLRHLLQNICDAGCLIHRRVFDAGLRFDETLRGGYEDWDFWLRCAAAGFRGVHCPDLGFRYRARRESMVADADRHRAALVAGLRQRHPTLYSEASVLRLEHAEAPRFCILHPAQDRFDLTAAPGASARGGRLAELDRLFWHAVHHKVRAHFPPFLVLLDRTVLLGLQRLRLADWLFWQIETLLEDAEAVAVRLLPSGGGIACAVDPLSEAAPEGAILATSFRTWHARLTAPPSRWRTRGLHLTAPLPPAPEQPTLAALETKLRDSPWRAPADGGAWRSSPLIPGHSLYLGVRELLQARGPLARGGGDSSAEIAVLAPTAPPPEAVVDTVRTLHAAGWRTRLILTATSSIEDPAALAPWCDLLALFTGGTDDRAGLLGLLAGCTAVLDCGTAAGLAVLGDVRRRGAAVVLALVPGGADVATALDCEHALDLVAVPSPRLLTLAQASGIPQAKLTLLEALAARPELRPIPTAAL